jgi:hypothetical protein
MMDQDVFPALLALDSYNRGYHPGIDGLAGNSIGEATIVRTDDDPDAQDIGFYAIAYSWNGETIISYRGTDESRVTILSSSSRRVRGALQRAGAGELHAGTMCRR